MILLSILMAAFGGADLIRGSEASASLRSRAFLACALAAALSVGMSRLAGLSWCVALWVTVGTSLIYVMWTAVEGTSLRSPLLGLLVVGSALATSIAASGSVDYTSGAFADLVHGLGFPALSRLPPDQVLVAMTGAVFLIGSANRIVRLVLAVAGTRVQAGETRLKGGRLLGPMERLIAAAMIVAGEPTGLAIIISAKGLIRFPEIRESAAEEGGGDDVTEYFLLGTLSSILIGVCVGLLVLAAA